MELGNRKKKIVLITTGQPSCNPRVVKEADAFSAAGYDVTLLYSFFISWAEEKDKTLLNHVAWKYKMIGGSPAKNKFLYLFTRTRYKISNILAHFFEYKFLFSERAQARAYDELLKEAKKNKADWYIGHNLGALAIAVKAAKYHNAKAGFDFEDYHREENNPIEIRIVNRVVYLENKYVSALDYYSTASDLITLKTRNNHLSFKGKVVTVLNCFPLNQQPLFKEKLDFDNTLQLFWFSQTIGANRGLEVLLDALDFLNNNQIHLTLVGRCNQDFLAYINNNYVSIKKNIHLVGIIQPEDLPAYASQFDIGMALELDVPKNRNICLTNKIFTYLLAGNAIILSETAMQLAFNNTFHIGESFAINDMQELVKKLLIYLDRKILHYQKKFNYELAKNSLNWENESKKLLAIID
jgi:hypothetical protein